MRYDNIDVRAADSAESAAPSPVPYSDSRIQRGICRRPTRTVWTWTSTASRPRRPGHSTRLVRMTAWQRRHRALQDLFYDCQRPALAPYMIDGASVIIPPTSVPRHNQT